MRSRMLVAAIAAVIGTSGIVAAMPVVAQTPNTSSSTDATALQQMQQQISALQDEAERLRDALKRIACSAERPATDGRAGAKQQGCMLAGRSIVSTHASLPAQTNTNAAAWADNTRISGTMYTDFTHIDQTSSGSKTNSSGTGLDVKRFYLSIDHQFDNIWSANLTTDFNYTSVTGETQLFVKKAYLQGAFSKLATLRVGSANMPWIPFVEDWYGYRFVENTLTDRLHFANSADWGLHLLGDNGTFDYQVSVVNGGGYKHPARSNSVDVEGRVGFTPVKGLVIAVGGYSGDLDKDTATSPALHTANRYGALVAYNNNGLRLGAEYFKADNWNNVATPLTDSANGYSLWGSYDFGPASIFARYDSANTSKQLDPSLKDTYYNAGVAFPVTKGVRLAVAYKHESLRDDSAVNSTTNEIGAWAEVKF